MTFRIYSGHHDEEYRLVDSLVEEQYLIGGVTAWIYAYQGPKGNKGLTDLTKPDYETLGSKITDIGNMIWMENSDRKYSLDAISLPVVYQTQDASMDLQIPGLFLFETMDATLPYNLMIKALGRKIMKGDVIELANLRDGDLLDEDDMPINRFYVVHDAFRSGDGYSHTWFHHIWKLRLVPMVDSPEFKDILGSGENDDDLKNHLSTAQRELNIMDLILGQADAEAPYMHWDNEYIHEALRLPAKEEVAKGYDYPQLATAGAYYIKQTMPVLYEWNTKWVRVPTTKGLTPPETGVDGDFFWNLHFDHDRPIVLTQYDAATNKWNEVNIEQAEELPINETSSGYFIQQLPDSDILILGVDGKWEIAQDEQNPGYTDNKHNVMDSREQLPDMLKVPRGSQFPQNAPDNSWFLRTDTKPEILWKFENLKWRKFNYGGRMPWTGTDSAKARYLNNREEIQPGIKSRQNTSTVLKPILGE